MKQRKPMNRRTFLGKCVTAGGVSLAAGALPKNLVFAAGDAPAIQTAQQRNVVLLISDDQGISQCGCYGNPVIKTPNIDALAAGGVRFTHAFAVAASCSSSRSTIFTGLYPHQNGQYGLAHRTHKFGMHDWVQTLPALLKKNGYRTGVIGKLHVKPEQNFPYDFTVSQGIMGNRDVGAMAEKAAEFFERGGDRPFFLSIGYSDPHRRRDGFGNDEDYSGITPVRYDPAEVIVPGFLPDTRIVRKELADMYQSVTRMDEGVGMVLDHLRLSGRYDDTLIIYISDNGIPFPNAKTNLYDAGVRLPMIVRSPAVARSGIVNHAMVSFLDLVPTILDWTGTAKPDYDLPGRSFLSVLGQTETKGWDEVYHSHSFHELTMNYPMRSVRTRRFKYILNLFPELEYPFASDLFASKTWQEILHSGSAWLGKRRVSDYLQRPAEELYDVEKDPYEVANLAKNPDYSSVLKELRTKLKTMREQTNDPWLILDNYRGNRMLYRK